MNGHFVIMYKATTETGKEFNYFSYIAIKMGYNMMKILRNIPGYTGNVNSKIEVKCCYQFQTKKEAKAFADHNNQGADHNGTGLKAFLDEIGL